MTIRKERVIAIDYFRGLCMLAVILDHSSVFSHPLDYLVGAGRLWTSAAEMFFLLSGITFWVVRGNGAANDARAVVKKTWKRAGMLYGVNLAVALISLSIATMMASRNITATMPEALPTASFGNVLINLILLKYSFGWANFLMFYSVFLFLAPPVLYLMKSRFWASVPLTSLAIYAAAATGHLSAGAYTGFLIWQAYFFLGLTIGKMRIPALQAFHKLPKKVGDIFTLTVVAALAMLLIICGFLEFKTTESVRLIANSGWLPQVIKSAAIGLMSHKPQIDHLFEQNRTGLLRPVFSVWTLGAGYILYQKFKRPLLKHSGGFINAIGRNSLWVFVAQAITIPLLAVLPVSHNILPVNMLITALLLVIMWLVTKRHITAMVLKAYSTQFYTVLFI